MSKTKTKTEPKTVNPVQQELLHLDLSQLFICLTKPDEEKASVPSLNFGRHETDWKNPWATIPTDLVHGWNHHAGAIAVIPFADLQRLGVDKARYESDYKQTLIDNVTHLVPSTGLSFYVNSKADDNGQAIDAPTTLTRAELLDFIGSMSFSNEYAVISGQRRTFGNIVTMALRKKLGLSSFTIPAVIRRYETLTELELAQGRDNRDNIKSDYTPVGYVERAIKLLDNNPMMTETMVRLELAVKTGIGQKVFALAQLDRQLNLDLVKRLALPVVKDEKERGIYRQDGFVPFGGLGKEELAALNGRCRKLDAVPQTIRDIFGYRVESVAGENVKVCNWAEGVRATKEQVETYFRQVVEGKAKRMDALDKAKITAWLQGARPEQRQKEVILAQVLRAIVAGNTSFLNDPPSLDEQRKNEA